MKTFNNNTKLAKVNAYATGYYSQAETSGHIYLPVEIYEKYKRTIDKTSIYVSELDGKHSQTEADIEVQIDTLENFVNDREYDSYNNLLDSIADYVADSLGSDVNDTISEFTELIDKLAKKERMYVVTDKPVTINGTEIPANVKLEFLVKTPMNPQGFTFDFTDMCHELERNN